MTVCSVESMLFGQIAIDMHGEERQDPILK